MTPVSQVAELALDGTQLAVLRCVGHQADTVRVHPASPFTFTPSSKRWHARVREKELAHQLEGRALALLRPAVERPGRPRSLDARTDWEKRYGDKVGCCRQGEQV